MVSLEVLLCARAEAAADFADFEADLLRSVFDAAVAARFPVRSVFLGMLMIPFGCIENITPTKTKQEHHLLVNAYHVVAIH